MRKVLLFLLVFVLFVSLQGFSVKALNEPEPDLIMEDEIPSLNRERPDLTKGIPMVPNYVVIDGVKIPKYYAELPIVQDEGKIRLILTLQEPPLIKKGNAIKIKLQQDAVIKYLETNKIQFKVVTKTQNVYNQITIEIPIKEYNKLGKIPYVKRVSFPRVWNLNLDYSVPLIQGGEPSGGLGYTGDGIVVGIVDTGIDYNHPDLGGPGFPNSKVIAGYDFGDMDADPRDCNGHGTHVAGIVAADGAIKGVAKDAKLVAAKIVSGCLGRATSESIIAAFEYLTNLGVNVINMSFGSDCGFNQPDDPEQIAIANAVSAGITVAISAGNDYYQYYPYIWRTYFGSGKYSMVYPDIGVVGDPSTTPGVISVASSDNSYMKVPYALETSTAPNRVLEYMVGSPSPDPVQVLGTTNEYDVQFVGYGNYPSDFSSFVPGRVALMERGGPGDPTFVNKVRNAQNAGAIAAIVHNHSSGGDALLIMALASDITIPAIFIGNSDGMYLRSLSSPKIRFTGNLTGVPVPTVNQPSSFTSWGLTPFMEGKPELSAPGGYIYSTVPDGGYAVYSGTSMASPHVAGAAALMLQKDPTLKPEEIKNIFMITSTVLAHPAGFYFSPRLQGAGRINMVNALRGVDYKVLVYGNNPNSPWITGDSEYGSIFREKIKVVNKTSSPLTYNLSGVRMIWFVRSYLYSYGTGGFTFRDLSLNPITSITVPSNGSVEFYMELNMTLFNAFDNVFVDGFIFLNSTGAQPTLHIPFSILHGDWQDTSYDFGTPFYTHNPVIDPPVYDPDERWWWFGFTWLYYLDGTTFYPLGSDFNGNLIRSKIAISPNRDGVKDEVWAILSLLRGTKEIQFKVLNSSKTTTIVTPIIDTYVRKNSLVSGWYQYWYGWNYDWVWDGKSASGVTLPDGNYFFRIQAEAGTDPTGGPKSYDIKDFPLIIDTISPIISWSLENSGSSPKLIWSATDERSGIWGFRIIKNGELVAILPPATTSYDLEESPIGNTYIVEAIDFAGNSSYYLPTVYNSQKGYYFQINPANRTWRFIWPSKNIYLEPTPSTRFEYDYNTGKGFVVYADGNINLVFDGNFYRNSFRLILNMKKEKVTIHDVVGRP